MSVEITPQMVEVGAKAYRDNFRNNGAPRPALRAALRAVLAMPELRRAVVADMPTDEVMEALHASSYATPEEAAAAMMAAVHKADDEPEAWGLR